MNAVSAANQVHLKAAATPLNKAALSALDHEKRSRKLQRKTPEDPFALMPASFLGVYFPLPRINLTRRSRNQIEPKIEKLEPPAKCLRRSVAIGRGAWREKYPAKTCKDLLE